MWFSGKRRNRVRRQPAISWTLAVARLPALNWRLWGQAALVLVLVTGATVALRTVLNQPIRSISVAGRFQRVSALDIEKAVREVSRDQGLLGINLQHVVQAVRAMGWVDSVTVGRRWPNGLAVHVIEQVPVALWNQSSLLNARGEVFVRDLQQIPPELPQLFGPEGSQMLVTQRYLAAQTRITGMGMQLTRITLEPRGAWEFGLSNGVVLRLGQANVDARFERFMATGSRVLANRAQEIAYIDLRYASGFAVGLRTKESG